MRVSSNLFQRTAHLTVTRFSILMVCWSAQAADVHWTNILNQFPYVAGDTVHLHGTFTNSVTITNSGTAGSPITFLFATDAKFSTGVIADDGSYIVCNNRSWLTFDGGSNGRMEFTNNGTSLGFQRSLYGIRGAGVGNITVQNLTFTNLYKRTPGADANRYGIAVALDGSNITITNCNASEGDTMFATGWSTGTFSNHTFVANTITRCNHGITMGCNTTNAFLLNVLIHNNRIDNLNAWDGHVDLHLDGMIIFNEAVDYSGHISNFVISANWIGPNIGTNTTSGIFLNMLRASQIVDLSIINNVSTQLDPFSWNNGHISIGGCTNNSIVANNSIVNLNNSRVGLGMQIGPCQVGITNNLLYGLGAGISLGPLSAFPPTFSSDYNIFYNVTSPGSGAFAFPGFSLGSWANWTNSTAEGAPVNYDTHSTTNQPSLSSSYVPTAADVVARNAGVNLSSFFAADFLGRHRGLQGAWDIGAFEYVPPAVTISRKATLSGKVILR